MIQDASKNNAQIATTEGIDFNKLRATIRENFIWIILIFIVTNTIAYLIIRYTKDLYESVSEIKLDVKNDATALGIPNIGADELQNADLISGEIEIIRS
jgi:tyrosine-protein kinase Etk/Wzc